MKRIFALLLALSLLLPTLAFAQDQTVSIATTFAGYDLAAQAYADALEGWEATSGNVTDDYSAMPDETWLAEVDALLQSGQLDVLYTSLELEAQVRERLVPVAELLAADASLPVRAQPTAVEQLAPATPYGSLVAQDGQIYAMPVRYAFEGLYVNTDVFIEHGVPVPDSWDSLLAAVDALRRAGVTPIANALNDWPFALVDCMLLSVGSAEQYLDPATHAALWEKGLARIRTLYEHGAFGDQALAWTEADAESAFIRHEAAMRFDGEWLCESIPEAQWNNTVVVSIPGETPRALVGGTNAGFFITRAAFDDPTRREAALSLLKCMVSAPTASTLFLTCGDALQRSVETLVNRDSMLCPSLMDLMDYDAYDTLMAQLGGVADGSADIAATVRTAL